MIKLISSVIIAKEQFKESTFKNENGIYCSITPISDSEVRINAYATETKEEK